MYFAKAGWRGGVLFPDQSGDPKMDQNDPKMGPFWGGQNRENTMKTNGFGSKSALRGIHFWLHFWYIFGSIFGPDMRRQVQPAGQKSHESKGMGYLGDGGYF